MDVDVTDGAVGLVRLEAGVGPGGAGDDVGLAVGGCLVSLATLAPAPATDGVGDGPAVWTTPNHSALTAA